MIRAWDKTGGNKLQLTGIHDRVISKGRNPREKGAKRKTSEGIPISRQSQGRKLFQSQHHMLNSRNIQTFLFDSTTRAWQIVLLNHLQNHSGNGLCDVPRAKRLVKRWDVDKNGGFIVDTKTGVVDEFAEKAARVVGALALQFALLRAVLLLQGPQPGVQTIQIDICHNALFSVIRSAQPQGGNARVHVRPMVSRIHGQKEWAENTTNQSINQSIDQLNNQSINQSTVQSSDQEKNSINQSIDRSIQRSREKFNQSINQSFDRPLR